MSKLFLELFSVSVCLSAFLLVEILASQLIWTSSLEAEQERETNQLVPASFSLLECVISFPASFQVSSE